MVRTIFSYIDAAPEDMEFTVKVSYLEIYLEKIKDLLQPKHDNLRIFDDKIKGMFVQNLTEQYCTDEQ